MALKIKIECSYFQFGAYFNSLESNSSDSALVQGESASRFYQLTGQKSGVRLKSFIDDAADCQLCHL